MSRLDNFKNLIIITFLVWLMVRLLVTPEVKHQQFSISDSSILFHSNWTETVEQVRHVPQLHSALTLPKISDVDISFAYSTFDYNDIRKLLPKQFLPYKTLKLNLGNLKMGT
jgi:hypothetical protein